MRASNDAKGNFLAAMSHEMRTPLNGVLGMLQLAMGHQLPELARQNVSNAVMSAEHLLNLVNDILDVSKIEAGKIELENKPFKVRILAGVISGPLGSSRVLSGPLGSSRVISGHLGSSRIFRVSAGGAHPCGRARHRQPAGAQQGPRAQHVALPRLSDLRARRPAEAAAGAAQPPVQRGQVHHQGRHHSLCRQARRGGGRRGDGRVPLHLHLGRRHRRAGIARRRRPAVDAPPPQSREACA